MIDISLSPVESLNLDLSNSESMDISLIPVSELPDYEIDHTENIEIDDLTSSDNLEVDLKAGTVVRGSIVIPNPQDIPTDDLETVKIDEETFRIKDPQLSDWARQETKPSYTPEEIGAVNEDNELQYAEIDRMFAAVFGI